MQSDTNIEAELARVSWRNRVVATEDGRVALSPDRWQSLVDFIRVNYGDKNPEKQITVYEPTLVSGVLFLPAVYFCA